MKINEFNQPKQIDEGIGGALIGDANAAKIKGFFTGKGGKHQLIQDIFLTDFYQDALTSLDNGIKSGFVTTQPSAAPKEEPPVPGASAGLIESRYQTLNYIFESIISEQEQPNQNSSISISEYMLDWFGKYMQGVSWESKKDKVLPYIQQVEKTYTSDKGRAAIKNLAKVAFSLSKIYGTTPPAGYADAAKNAPASQPSKGRNPEQVAADLVALKPRERERVIQQVKKAT